MTSRVRLLRNISAAIALFSLGSASSLVVAGDKTWDGAQNTSWDTSSLNFGGTAWNNAAGDGAIFAGAGLGIVNLPGAINLDSLNLTTNGYTFNGTGPFNFVAGSSTLSTGVINVTSGITQINVPINSTQTAIQKVGAGVLELSQPVNVTASFPINSNINGVLGANVIIGPAPIGQSPVGGTLRLMNSGVLPASASVAIGAAGFLDIGLNNTTLSQLIFTNQTVNQSPQPTWPVNGIIGTGTLRVNGEINVIGVFGGNGSNTIATPLDLGGSTQIIRTNAGTSFAGNNAIILSGVISNGSLLKTLGYNVNGVYAAGDGMTLTANNTYTGSTSFNLGTFFGGNVVTGTNASPDIRVVNGVLTLQGANGSYGSATSLKVHSGATFAIDNNVTNGEPTGAGMPYIPAANNGNRIPDNLVIEVRDSNIAYRGLTTQASSETYGGLNITGGHNVLTITPNGTGGTASFLATGDLLLGSRATLQIAGTTLSLAGQVKFAGNIPAAVGGIIPRMIAQSDFLTYDATNGFTPLAAGAYSATFTPGTNVTRSASGNVGTMSINALRSTASNTTTIDAGTTLTVATGMIFSSSGTNTITGGTLDFGSTPGAFFGTNIVSGAITGSQGLLNAGTLTLSGNLSGLTGIITNSSSLTLNTNTFAGDIEVRRGSLTLGASANNIPAGGTIRLGVPENDNDLLPALPSLSLSSAGANAVMGKNIVVDNGGLYLGTTNAPLKRQSVIPSISPLSNSTGSQTISGDIVLNTSLNLQGGGASATSTGATIFSGTISGPETFVLANGRANFIGTLSNAGGMIISSGGFTGIANFSGTATGNASIILNGGSDSRTGFSYLSQSNIYAGPIIVQNASGTTAPTIRVLGNSSINNVVNLNGDVFVDVASGITGTWAGQVNGTRNLTKVGTGTLVLSNNGNTQTGTVTVNAGKLVVNGTVFSSSNPVTVNNNGTLGGSGTISRTVTVNAGGTLAPGTSPGILTIDGNLTLASGSTLAVELNGSSLGTGYDNITVNGTGRSVTITGSVLTATTTLSSMNPSDLMFVMILNDNTSVLTGNFAGIPQDGLVNIFGTAGEWFTAQVSYNGDSFGNTLTGGNDVVLYNFAAVPEPSTIAFFGLIGTGLAGGWYYRRRQIQKQLDSKFKRVR